ncbi:MAG: preprotein translocase subunit SecE [Methylovulum sp.]|nr:preprotein translocase subunit SecE [Methylovulum sp.]TSA40618.1 MAG: preprotein translocase subunit SecE [Methylococcaceae bacterium]
MNNKLDSSVSILDIVKQTTSVFLVVLGIFLFYYFSEFLLIYRVLMLIVLGISVVAIMLTTVLGKSLWRFFIESRNEVRKVVWPTKDETIRTTLLVFVMVFVVGLCLWLLDVFLLWCVRQITGQVG